MSTNIILVLFCYKKLLECDTLISIMDMFILYNVHRTSRITQWVSVVKGGSFGRKALLDSE